MEASPELMLLLLAMHMFFTLPLLYRLVVDDVKYRRVTSIKTAAALVFFLCLEAVISIYIILQLGEAARDKLVLLGLDVVLGVAVAGFAMPLDHILTALLMLSWPFSGKSAALLSLAFMLEVACLVYLGILRLRKRITTDCVKKLENYLPLKAKLKLALFPKFCIDYEELVRNPDKYSVIVPERGTVRLVFGSDALRVAQILSRQYGKVPVIYNAPFTVVLLVLEILLVINVLYTYITLLL